MKLIYSSISWALITLPLSLFADSQSLYCPQNHQYINLGMTPDQVIAACGQPANQEESNQPLIQKVPMTQLIYNNMGTSTAFYGVWNINTGSAGSRLEIGIVNQKVKEIKMNGNDRNGFSICGDYNIEVGDPVAKVYSACGTPSLVNNTYLREVVPSAKKPLQWTYQFSEDSSPLTLTFIDGRLKSINE